MKMYSSSLDKMDKIGLDGVAAEIRGITVMRKNPWKNICGLFREDYQ